MGTFVKLPGPAPVDLAAAVGLDLVVVDLEHSLLTDADAHQQVRHAAAIGLPALVRLPVVDPGRVNRLLEAGAAGVQLSTLRSAAAAHELRAALRHAPEGRRSISLAHPAAGWGEVPLAAHLAAEADCPPLAVGQVETATTDDPLDDVLAPLDVAFLGTTDLSVDLGRPGALDAPEVRARVAEVAEAAARTGTVLGGFAEGAPAVAGLAALDARFLVVGSDVAALRRGLHDAAGTARTEMERAP